jgi:hypothetical protein
LDLNVIKNFIGSISFIPHLPERRSGKNNIRRR